MTTADIYCRLSIFDESKDALERQEEDLREYAADKGIIVRRVWRDKGVSGFKQGVDRAAFKGATDALKAAEVDTLLVWKLDRLSRKGAGEIGTLLDDLKAAGTSILFYKDSLNTADENHRLPIVLLSEQARTESANTATRIGAKNGSLIKAGLPTLGKRRFGYLPADRTVGRVVNTVEHPEEGPRVRAMFAAFLAGASIRKMAQENEWTMLRVRETLANPAYAGTLKSGGTIYPAAEAVARLVSTEDFEKVQARLSANSAAWRGFQKPGGTVKHELSGIATCAVCGKPMIFRNEYLCVADLSHPSIRDYKLERFVRMEVALHFLDPKNRYADGAGGDDDLEAIAAEIAEINLVEEDILTGLSNGLKMSQLLPHIQPLQARRAALESRRDVILSQSIQARLIAEIIGKLEAELDPLHSPGNQHIAQEAIGDMHMDDRRELYRLFNIVVSNQVGPAKILDASKRVTVTRKRSEPDPHGVNSVR